MHNYSRLNLGFAEANLQEFPSGPASVFCSIPYKLVYTTITDLAEGREKLTRGEVLELVKE